MWHSDKCGEGQDDEVRTQLSSDVQASRRASVRQPAASRRRNTPQRRWRRGTLQEEPLPALQLRTAVWQLDLLWLPEELQLLMR